MARGTKGSEEGMAPGIAKGSEEGMARGITKGSEEGRWQRTVSLKFFEEDGLWPPVRPSTLRPPSTSLAPPAAARATVRAATA